MLKVRLNLRNMIAMAICLAGTIVFSGCSSEEPEQDPGDPPPTEQVLAELQMLVEMGERVIPTTYTTVSWKKDASDKFIRYFGYDVSYLNDAMKLTKITNYSNGVGYDTIQITLDNGTVKQAQHINVMEYPNRQSRSVKLRNYFYDAQGFLTKVTDPFTLKGEQDVLQTTVVNENITQIKQFDYSALNGEAFQVKTYNYMYDDNTFVPMSDWAPHTPLYVMEPLVTLYDNLLGKKSRNNVINVDIQHQNAEYQAHFNKLTYELEYNEQNKLAAIKHTGRVTKHQGDGGEQVDFDNTKTLFIYINE